MYISNGNGFKRGTSARTRGMVCWIPNRIYIGPNGQRIIRTAAQEIAHADHEIARYILVLKLREPGRLDELIRFRESQAKNGNATLIDAQEAVVTRLPALDLSEEAFTGNVDDIQDTANLGNIMQFYGVTSKDTFGRINLL